MLVDTTTTNTDMRGTDNAALASVCTETRLAELDADNLPLTTDQTLTDTGTTLPASLNVLSDKLDDIQGATFSSATDSLEAIRDRGDAAWTTGAGGSDRLLMVDTTIATLSSQTSFTLTAGSTDDDAYNNCTIVIEDASTSTQKAVGLISDYTGSTKTVTLKYDPGIFVMAATDKVYILAENSLKSTDQNRQLDVTATGAAGIDWGNVENPTTAVDLSGTDIQLCDTVTTNTDMVSEPPTANAIADQVWDEAKSGHVGAGSFGEEVQAHSLSSEISALNNISTAEVKTQCDTALTDYDAPTKTEMDTAFTEIKGATWSGTTDTLEHIRNKQTDIETDTNELQGDWADGGRLDLILDARASQASVDTVDTNVDAILVDTGTTLENHLTDIKGTGFVKDTDSLPQCLTATGFSTHDAAAVKTAMEASGSDLDYLIKALVNKLVITEANGNSEMFNDSSVSLGSVLSAFSSDGTYTTRKRMVI